MGKVFARKLIDGDVQYVINHMRQADIDELIACGDDVTKAVHFGVGYSSHLWVIERDGKAIAIGGAIPSPVYEGCAVIWMVSTDDISVNPVPVYRAVKCAIKKMLAAYNCLANYVDSRNKDAVEMLRRIGFTIESPVEHGPMRVPFHRFYKVVSDV